LSTFRATTLVLTFAFVLPSCGVTNSVPLASTESASAAFRALAAATTSDTPYTCPSAMTSSGELNCAELPLGDHKYSTTGAKAGYIYECSSLSGSPVVSSAPWLGSTTWNALEKVAVEGAVSWSGTFTQTLGSTSRTISGNALPVKPVTTGTFPISSSDPASAYDRNPNHIASHTIDYSLPANPSVAKSPSCTGGGAVGVATNGVEIYNGFDAAGYDAVAREEQDACHGHPDESDTYHYHGWLQACVTDSGSAKQNSSLLGYALDGFGIYGPWYDGKILTTADLDECHGTTSTVLWNGKEVSMYHYVSTYDFPYTIGCFRGTEAKRT
jgi:hypothetical protein